MGYWCTLHLFNDQKFYKQVIPKLKGRCENLASECKDFLLLHTIGGMKNLSEFEIQNRVNKISTSINKLSDSMDEPFKKHLEFSKIKDYEQRRLYLNNLTDHYEFCKFFEYYVFKYCTDFFPHISLGKGGISRNFKLNRQSISYSLISELDTWNDFFCGYTTGITNWLNHEEIELLYLDRENLLFDEKRKEKGESIRSLLEIAYHHKLGLIVGVDMNGERLKNLPANKLISAKDWESLNTEGMLLKS